jgi:acyl CoA:acetate/3-ketoacid CoA transferase alpha subunit/acyl CoA:acetate/3-ketoacid CoA transferase beta subunit
VEHLTLADAVARHVRPGDALQVFYGHSRWNAPAREVVRQFWGTDPGFELQFVSLGNLGTLFVHGGLVRRIVSAYVGDGFPTGGPNPLYVDAVRSGRVEVEHTSILTFQQRVEAAARGLPAAVTRSLAGTDIGGSSSYAQVDTPFGTVGLVAPLVPDVWLAHAPVADRAGNVAMAGPLMEGAWGGWAARRGAIVSVEQVVDDLSSWGDYVVLPAHRVLAVVEAPFGAHPGGLFARGLPADGYGEDIPFWNDVARASRGDFDAWIREWVLDVPDQATWNAKVGAGRLEWLRGRTDPESWREDDAAHPLDESAGVTPQEVAAAVTARVLADRVAELGADAILAGAGLSNLAAWAGAGLARERGHEVVLTAEMGMWDYTPTPADPYIFNHRVFPGASMLTDCSHVLGLMVSGPGTVTIGCMSGAEIDRHGNINSTDIPGTRFLAGSGGGADVAAGCDETIVALVGSPRRLVDRCAYVTSPGERVTTVCTDLGVLRKRDGELKVAAVLEGAGDLDERVRRMVASVGWAVEVDREPAELPAPSAREIRTLRGWDRERILLS